MTRPLVVRFGALGDMVLMTVAIRVLAERFGSPVDVLGSGAWTRPLLQDQPGVGEIFLLGSRKTPFWLARDQQRLVRRLRTRGAGPTWLFDVHNDKTRRLLQRAGWHAEQFASLDSLPDISGEHFCDHWRRFALLDPPALGGARHGGEGGEAVAPAVPELTVSPAIRAEALDWLHRRGLSERPLILIQVGNKRTMRPGRRRRPSNTKYWPESHWADLLRTLRALHPGHALLLLGIAPEAPINDDILALAQLPHAHNLARDMSVPRLMGLAERAAGMISVDTGPAHVAAALGCPVLTLFDSAVKADMYVPRGPAGASRRTVISRAPQPSLLGVGVQEVLAAWRAMALRTGEPTGEPTQRVAIAVPSSRAVEG